MTKIDKNKKQTLKEYLISHNIVKTEEEAKREVLAGNVINANRKFSSAMEMVFASDSIWLKKANKQYVSRGGDKIASTFKEFNISVLGQLCIDCGASTGGFTDFLIQQGAQNVIAIDVGYGILAHKLMVHPKVLQIERTNIRNLNLASISALIQTHKKNLNGEIKLPASIVTADLSFISLRIILPVIKNFICSQANLLLLFKPQFELPKEHIPKGGVVTNTAEIKQSIQDFILFSQENGYKYITQKECKVKGTKGNQEFFIHLQS